MQQAILVASDWLGLARVCDALPIGFEPETQVVHRAERV